MNAGRRLRTQPKDVLLNQCSKTPDWAYAGGSEDDAMPPRICIESADGRIFEVIEEKLNFRNPLRSSEMESPQVTQAMRKTALIYNPASGMYSARRRAAIEKALEVFRRAGIEAEALETKGAGTAAALAREAVQRGCDTIVACGGDGTVHEILQELAGTETALGVIPFGTANALAADLGLIGSPEGATRKLLGASPTKISIGRIHYLGSDGNPASRYFIVAAGIGADALLMSRLDARLKRRLGYVLYLIEAVRIWATHSFPLFETTLPAASGNGAAQEIEVSQLLAVRVRSFGGVLNYLAPGASLRNGKLSLLAFKTQSRLRYMKFLLAVVAGRHTFSREIQLLEAPSVVCRAPSGSREHFFVEADGEVLGSLPVRIEVVPHSLNLLVPPGAQP
jgi:diacylglycerol kinase (ATP)